MIQNKFSFDLPEGLVWSSFHNLFLFVDIKLNSLFSFNDGYINLLHKFNENISFVFPYCHEDLLICGLESGIYSFKIEKKELKIIQSINLEEYRLNDGFLDENNILWFGIMPKDDNLISSNKKSALYSFSIQTGLIIEDNDYYIPNGPLVSKDKKWLYHSDSMLGFIYRYPYSKQKLDTKKREIFFNSNNYSNNNPSPDGMTLDIEGNLFVAMWGIGEVWKIDNFSNLIGRFKIIGTNTTNVCFGGNGYDTLLVTYAKSKKLPGGIQLLNNHKTKGTEIKFAL